MTGKHKEIWFGHEFGDVVVNANGVSIEIHADGSILTHRKAASTSGAPANGRDKGSAPASPKIGEEMPDGTIYAGVSPDTNKPMYAMPADATLTFTFNEAQRYAQTLNASNEHGHQDWRVPTKAELNVLFNNRAEIGGFNISGSYPGGWYWSSSSDDNWTAWAQRSSDGFQNDSHKDLHSSVRCVR